LPESQNLSKVYNKWGGATAAFFTYTHFSHDLCAGLLSALLPLIRVGLGINYLQAGLLLSANTITAGLFQFFGGWLGDKISRPTAITIGIGGVGLSAFLVGLSTSYYPLLIILIVMGIFSGPYHPSAVSFISGFFGEDKRGKVLALHMVGGSIGFSIGPLIGGLIAASMGWRFSYIILSIPLFIAAFLVFRKFQRKTGTVVYEQSDDLAAEQGVVTEPAPEKIGLSKALKPLALILILATLTHFTAGAAMAFLPIYLVDKHSIAPASAAMFMSLIRGAGIIGSLFGGWLSDRWTRRNAIVLALAATGPALYLMTLVPFNPASAGIFMLFGLLMYMRSVVIQPLVMDSVPVYLRSTVIGIYFGLMMEGSSLMQPLVGYFMDIFGIIDVFQIIAFIGIGISLISLIVLKTPVLNRY
jgi:FSR family fosmidomycin resistance protein-like MFS transporter